jgi:hypothetical protein
MPDLSRTRAALVLAATFLALAACGGKHTGGTGGSTGGGGGSGDGCSMACAIEAAACPKTKPTVCQAGCEATKTEVAWCTPQVTVATDCLAMQPATSFQCDMNGQAVAKAGVCETALSVAQSCWYKGPPAGLPDMSQTCSEVCGKQMGLSCADPNCVAGCQAAVMSSQKCNGAFAALITCGAKQDASSFECDTEMPPRAALKQGICEFEVLLWTGCLQQP